MRKQEYNGWYNWETWVVGVWIDNNQTLYYDVKEMAQRCWDDTPELSAYAKWTGKEIFTREEKAVYSLSNELKEKFEEDVPELEGVWADLLGAALEEVNWKEIAEGWIEESVDKTETEEVTDD